MTRILRFFVRLMFFLIADIDVRGLENLLPHGAYVIASNHLGRLDVALVYQLFNRQDIIIPVAEKYQKVAIFRWIGSWMNVVWLDRFTTDFHALRIALDKLKAGGVLIIAPEGTRSKTGALIQARSGGGYLAAKAGVPVVPVAVWGTEDAQVKADLRHLKRIKVQVRIGTPITLSPLTSGNRGSQMEKYTEEIMCQIGARLPPQYRGVYADHPRLKELLTITENA